VAVVVAVAISFRQRTHLYFSISVAQLPPAFARKVKRGGLLIATLMLFALINPSDQ